MTNHLMTPYDGMTIWTIVSANWNAAKYTDIEAARAMIMAANPTIRDWTSNPLIDKWGNIVPVVNVPYL